MNNERVKSKAYIPFACVATSVRKKLLFSIYLV